MTKKGFTLVELLIYMALSMIFMGILTDLFVSTLNLKQESIATSSVESDGRFILSRLIYDANTSGAESIATNYSLVGNDLMLSGQRLNSSETKVSDLTFLNLGNVGGKQSVQVKFRLESVVVRNSGPEVRDYQITVGSR